MPGHGLGKLPGIRDSQLIKTSLRRARICNVLPSRSPTLRFCVFAKLQTLRFCVFRKVSNFALLRFSQSFKLCVFAFLQSFKLYVFTFSQSFTLCVFAFCCAHERGRSSEQDQVTSGQWGSTAATRHTFFVSEACCLAAPSAGSSSTSSRDTFC